MTNAGKMERLNGNYDPDYVEVAATVITRQGQEAENLARQLRLQDQDRRIASLAAEALPGQVSAAAIANSLDENEVKKLIRELRKRARIIGQGAKAGLVQTDMARKQLLREDLWKKMAKEGTRSNPSEETLQDICVRFHEGRRRGEAKVDDEMVERLIEYREQVLDVLEHEAFEDYVNGTGVEDRQRERDELKKNRLLVFGVPLVIGVGAGVSTALLTGVAPTEAAIMSLLGTVVAEAVSVVNFANRIDYKYDASKEGEREPLRHLNDESSLHREVDYLRTKLEILSGFIEQYGKDSPEVLVELSEKYLLALKKLRQEE